MKGDLFKRFQEQQIKNLLGEVELTKDEEYIITIISVGKGAIPLDFFKKNYSHLLSSINHLIDCLMVEIRSGVLRIHPIFKDYYYNKLTIKKRVEIHQAFSDYYEKKYEDQSKERANPVMLSNLIYHLAGSMQRSKFQQYKLRYIEEILPIANELFYEKCYEEALNYYLLIHDHISQRKDILIKMAQAYVYCDNIDNAEKFFKMATESNPRGAYLYAKYSIALSSRTATQKRAKEIAAEAETIYYQYGNTRIWELAEVKYAQAKSLRNSSPEKAQKLYEEVCDLEKTNSYYLCMFAKFLFEHNQPVDGKKILYKAKDINPNYQLYIRFNEKYIKAHSNNLTQAEEDESDDVGTYEEGVLEVNSLDSNANADEF